MINACEKAPGWIIQIFLFPLELVVSVLHYTDFPAGIARGHIERNAFINKRRESKETHIEKSVVRIWRGKEVQALIDKWSKDYILHLFVAIAVSC